MLRIHRNIICQDNIFRKLNFTSTVVVVMYTLKNTLNCRFNWNENLNANNDNLIDCDCIG